MFAQKRKVVNKMDTKKFKEAVALLCKEKGISEDIIYDAMELALTSAYKKNYNSLANVRVEVNRDTGEIKVFSFKTVVDRAEEEKYKKFSDIDFSDINEEDEEDDGGEILPFIYDEKIHLTIEEARKMVPDIQIGETIEEEVTPSDFGRVAASTAKQVVIQKIKEAEKEVVIEEFSDKEGEMVVGIVTMEDARNYYVELGRILGILPKTELIPNEKIEMSSSIKVYITKVDSNSRGPIILLSRVHYGFVKRLFELEIPEINEGIILVYSVARDPGNRTKVAVYSENPNVDPIGSCIGEHGSRINRIINELKGEKIDMIPYDKDPAKFIENALSPAKDMTVIITDEKKKEAMAIVSEEALSLAIGKKGMNVKLASRLTHYKIDVKTYEQAREMGINIVK